MRYSLYIDIHYNFFATLQILILYDMIYDLLLLTNLDINQFFSPARLTKTNACTTCLRTLDCSIFNSGLKNQYASFDQGISYHNRNL